MFPYSSAEEQKAFASRSCQEMWAHHNKSLAARDISEFIKDFSKDCVFINNPLGGHAQGTYTGPSGVKEWCKKFFDLFDVITEFSVPLGAHLSHPELPDGMVMISWEIKNDRYRVSGGVDTFVITNGLFTAVTVVYDAQYLT
jgi:hypothetical protein